MQAQGIAGTDEAGRGCLAGPVVAAAVILPQHWELPGLTDSKLLSAKRRQGLVEPIKAQAVSWGLGVIWPSVIDRFDILQATKQAMLQALDTLKHPYGLVLVDGNQPLPLDGPQRCIIKGDQKEPCIAAASILAKTFRDRIMVGLARRYPGYGFAVHKGYGTKGHRIALRRLGPSPMHRRSFKGVVQGEEQLCLPGI